MVTANPSSRHVRGQTRSLQQHHERRGDPRFVARALRAKRVESARDLREKKTATSRSKPILLSVSTCTCYFQTKNA